MQEEEFYLDFNGTVGIPRCNPIETYDEGDRTILRFSIGDISVPKLVLGRPPLTRNYAELVASDGTVIKISFGRFGDATYNWGDPLPARYYVDSVRVNGEDVYWKYIDSYYPWVKYDLESVVYKLYDIYKEEKLAS